MTTRTDTSRPPSSSRGVDLLVLSASSRRGSHNTRLAQLARGIVKAQGGTTTLATIDEFDTPNYNRDDQDRHGFPDGAPRLRERLENTDAFVGSPPRSTTSPSPAG